jgi:hypothetical protein
MFETFTIDSVLDTTQIMIYEDFLSGRAGQNVNSIGNFLWASNDIGTPVAAAINSVSGAYSSPYFHSGILDIDCGTSSGTGQCVALCTGSSVAVLGQLGVTTKWQSTFVFKISATTSVRFRIGFANQFANLQPTEGIWLRFDTNAGDTAFNYECRSASTSTVSGTTATVDTNWHILRIRCDTSGTIIFTLDSNAEVTINTNVPSTGVLTAVVIISSLGSSRTCSFDKFSFFLQGLNR